MRELATRQSRSAGCRPRGAPEAAGNHAEARRAYAALAVADDTGPAALLGLSRARAARRPGARRSGARRARGAVRGAHVRGRAGAGRRGHAARGRRPDEAEALLGVAEDVLAGRLAVEPIVRLGVYQRIRARLDRALSPAQQAAARLDERVGELRRARAAAGLADDVAEIARTAAPAWRARRRARAAAHARVPAPRRRRRRGHRGRRADARGRRRHRARRPGAAARARWSCRPVPRPARRCARSLQVPLGTALPHLALAIVNPLADPDPLDEVIQRRSRRHVVYMSGLAVALGIGLLATIRGAVRARELAQLKSDFVSTVSHELKTPLTSIRMFAEMLEQGVARGDAEKLARYHGVIVQESQRLGLLIANLLDYAQIERGTRRYVATREGWEGLVRHAVTTFETLRDPDGAERNRVDVEVSPDAMRAEVEVDRDVVVQAVLNLLANAVKYGGGSALPIEVRIGATTATAWVSVRDHGPGIAPAEQARIFREFYRTPEAYRSNVEGTGLGLALVKQHVEALGGAVEVESVVGQGAKFTISLPRTDPAGGAEEARA